jgi:hypothetical protein
MTRLPGWSRKTVLAAQPKCFPLNAGTGGQLESKADNRSNYHNIAMVTEGHYFAAVDCRELASKEI